MSPTTRDNLAIVTAKMLWYMAGGWDWKNPAVKGARKAVMDVVEQAEREQRLEALGIPVNE